MRSKKYEIARALTLSYVSRDPPEDLVVISATASLIIACLKRIFAKNYHKFSVKQLHQMNSLENLARHLKHYYMIAVI